MQDFGNVNIRMSRNCKTCACTGDTITQGRRGPPGHREIVPVAPESHADMGPLKLSLKKIIQGVSKKLFDVSLNNKKQLYAEWALG